MTQLSLDEASEVGGASAGSALRLYIWVAELAWSVARNGGVDYAGVAESSGTHYNMMGA